MHPIKTRKISSQLPNDVSQGPIERRPVQISKQHIARNNNGLETEPKGTIHSVLSNKELFL